MKKKLATIGLIVLSTLTFTTTSFAAGWRQNKTGWWYQKNDGDCVKMEWRNIDGKWYYFDLSGYMVHDQWVGDYYVGPDEACLPIRLLQMDIRWTHQENGRKIMIIQKVICCR